MTQFQRPRPQASHLGVEAVVKWFNPTKGFGFVTFEGATNDAFLHVTTLNAAGHQAVAEGATLICDLAQGQRGLQVVSISSIDTSTATDPVGGGGGAPPMGNAGRRPPPGGPRDGGFGAPRNAPSGPTETIEGTVKFYNLEKGFGFVVPDSGGQDVFVHARALERSHLSALEPSQRVRVETRMGQKGPMAESVELI